MMTIEQMTTACIIFMIAAVIFIIAGIMIYVSCDIHKAWIFLTDRRGKNRRGKRKEGKRKGTEKKVLLYPGSTSLEEETVVLPREQSTWEVLQEVTFIHTDQTIPEEKRDEKRTAG